MSIEAVSYFVLLSFITNAAAFAFSAYVLFGIYKIPFYHIMTFYMIYFFLGFVARPLEVWLHGSSQPWDVIGAVPDWLTILWATAVALVAHFALLAGFVLNNREFRPVGLLTPINFKVRNPATFAAMIVLYLAAGVYGNRSAFSLDNIVVYDARGALQMTTTSGYQTVVQELLPVALITLFAIKRTRILSIVLTAIYVIYRMSVGSGRSAFVALLICLGLMWLINARLRLPTPRVLIGGVALLLVFNIIGANRNAIGDVLSGEKTISEVYADYTDESQYDRTITQNMAEYDVFTSLLTHIPSDSGYSYGTQYIRVLVWPIPRFWWKDKPIFTTNVDVLDYGRYTNFTYTLFFDAYESLGLVSLVIVLLGVSLYLNWLYRSLCARPTALKSLIYLIHISYSSLLFRDGIGSVSYFYISLSIGAFLITRISGLTIDPRAASRGRPRLGGTPPARLGMGR